MAPTYDVVPVGKSVSEAIQGFQGRLNIEPPDDNNIVASRPVCAVLLGALCGIFQHLLDYENVTVRVTYTQGDDETVEVSVAATVPEDVLTRGLGGLMGKTIAFYQGETSLTSRNDEALLMLRIPRIFPNHSAG